MKQLIFPRGWHCRNLPTGEYVVLQPGEHVKTHMGLVEFTDSQQQPLFLDLSVVGGFKFAGQSWLTNDDALLEWEGGWKPKGRGVPGVSPVVYDDGGRVLANIAWGTQGARYYDSRQEFVMTGDETYGPFAGVGPGEWTKLPCGLVIGQRGDHKDEFSIYDPATKEWRRLPRVAEGDTADSLPNCRFIHGCEANGVIALSCYRLNDATNGVAESVLTWATEAELRGLPVEREQAVEAIAPTIANITMGGTWVATADAPGNLALGRAGVPDTGHAAVIVLPETYARVPEARRVGLLMYLDGSVADTDIKSRVETHLILARQLKLPLFVYDDRADGRCVLTHAACNGYPMVWMPQWYRQRGESITQFLLRLGDSVVAYSQRPFLPVIRAYTSLNTIERPEPFDAVPEDAVIEALNALITSGADRLPGYLGPLFFAYERGDGMTNRPRIRAAVEKWLSVPTTLTSAREWAANQFPKEPTVNVPNHFDTVKEVFAAGGYKLDTKEGCGVFVDDCVRRLRDRDKRWHHLTKRPEQNNVDLHAVDYILYVQDSGPSSGVDIISGSGEAGASITWQPEEVARYAATDGVVPEPFSPSRVERPVLPTLRGMTGFDFGTFFDPNIVDKAAARDKAATWLAIHKQYNLPVVRIVAQSVFRTPRSLTDGRVQLDAALAFLAGTGCKALVDINCDTGQYAMDRMAIIDNTAAVNDIMVRHLPVVAAAALCNENFNWNESPLMGNRLFLKRLDSLVDARIPLAWGVVGGFYGEETSAGGSWIAHHADRGKAPEENGQIMATLKSRYGKPVMDREQIGFAAVAIPGKRYSDVAFAKRLGVVARERNLSFIFHTEAGLTADAAKFGPEHHLAAKALTEGLAGTPNPGPVPGPIPGHPVLDATLSYLFFINNWVKIMDEADLWYKRYAGGRAAGNTDIGHMVYRAFEEVNKSTPRWTTLRQAWMNDKPEGAPK